MKQKIAIIASVFLLSFGIASNGLAQWVHVINPLEVYCLIEHDSLLFAGSYGVSNLYFSNDHGVTWTSSQAHFPAVGILALAFKDTILFAGSDMQGVWRTTDLGNTWIAANAGMSSEPIYGLTVIGSNIIASAGNGLYVSSDEGSTWKKTSDHYTYEFSCTPVASGGGMVYAATTDHLLISADSGFTWSIALDSTMWWAVASDDLNAYATGNLGFFRSSDHGKSWSLTSNANGGCLTLSGKNILLGPQRTNDATCFLSSDLGMTWINLQEGHRSTSLIVSGPNIVKGSNNTGIWLRSLTGTLDEVKSSLTPNLTLTPNPTTGIITVHNAPANILNVTVSSILGESVLELEHPNAPEFTLDLSKLPAGMYYARIVGAHSVSIEKIFKE